MNVRLFGTGVSVVLAAVAVACGSSSGRSGFEEQQASSATDPGMGGAADGPGFGGSPDASMQGCSLLDDTDHDGDGLSGKAGDCNDCDPRVHPGFYDLAGNGVDEDCSGTPDDGEATCDDGLSINPGDAFDAAKAMGLCKKADAATGSWGVVSAKFVRPDGTNATVSTDVGVLPKFGVNAPQAGKALLALSTGYARAPGDPGWVEGPSRDKAKSHNAPAGYPKEFAGCPDDVTTGAPQDGIALEVKIRVPKNAKSFSYDQNFFTFEYSRWVCSEYNDFFVTLMQPKLAALADENIAFDSQNNPISVNNAFLQACKPANAGGKQFTCPLGIAPLDGTGFEERTQNTLFGPVKSGPFAATGWLTTTAPVEAGGEITLRFAIWDSGDGNLDSTVLLDNFKWSAETSGAPVTSPVK